MRHTCMVLYGSLVPGTIAVVGRSATRVTLLTFAAPADDGDAAPPHDHLVPVEDKWLSAVLLVARQTVYTRTR